LIVLDASAALSQVLRTQTTAASDAFFKTASQTIAPSIFAWEVRHVLLKAERMGRIDAEGLNEGVLVLEGLAEIRASNDGAADFARLIAIARAENLSLFDAAYLDLAITERASLASRDVGLLDAAKRRGVKFVDLR
jgi:predicted nucleic acid-binding protein